MCDVTLYLLIKHDKNPINKYPFFVRIITHITYALRWCFARFYYSSEIGYQSRKTHAKLIQQNTFHRVFRMCVGLKNIGFDVPNLNRGGECQIKITNNSCENIHILNLCKL